MSKVRRVYVEKKEAFAVAAKDGDLYNELYFDDSLY